MTSPYTVQDATSKREEAPHASATNSQYLVDGPNSLKIAARRLPIVNTLIVIPGVTEARPTYVIAPPNTSFYLGHNT